MARRWCSGRGPNCEKYESPEALQRASATPFELTGVTWEPTRVVFTTRYQVFEVSPDGGTARALTEPDKRRSTPFLLPGENAFLYTKYGKPFTSGDEQVMIRRLVADAQPQVLLSEAADARYIPIGHLVFMRQGTLFVVRFDPQTFALRGSPVAIVSNVAQSAAAWFADDLTLSGQFAISSRELSPTCPARRCRCRPPISYG